MYTILLHNFFTKRKNCNFSKQSKVFIGNVNYQRKLMILWSNTLKPLKILGVKQCVKSVRIWNYSGLDFPTVGLNTEMYLYTHSDWIWRNLINILNVKSVQIRSFFWVVFSRIQSQCRKIRTRKHSVFGHFSRSVSIFS